MSHRHDLVIAYKKTLPVTSQKLYGKAASKHASPRQAIKAKCLDCSAYQRKEITACTAYTCPLWAYRPFQERPSSVQNPLREASPAQNSAETG